MANGERHDEAEGLQRKAEPQASEVQSIHERNSHSRLLLGHHTSLELLHEVSDVSLFRMQPYHV